MHMKRILITGAGGPAAQSLLTHEKLNTLELHAADADGLMPGFLIHPRDKRHVVPMGHDPLFPDHMLRLCQEHCIDILWPTTDVELLPLALCEREFRSNGIRIVTSPYSTLLRIADKALLMKALEGQIELAPWDIFDENFSAGPSQAWFLRSRTGSGSREIEFHKNRASIEARPRDPQMLAQAYLPGPEYSTDLFRSRKGDCVSVVVRTRARTNSGISTMSEVVDEPEIELMARIAANTLDLHGVSNIRFKLDTRGQPRLLGIHPRVPGGIPLAVAAGCDLPWYTYLDTAGIELPPASKPKPIVMLRTLANHFVTARSIRGESGTIRLVRQGAA